MGTTTRARHHEPAVSATARALRLPSSRTRAALRRPCFTAEPCPLSRGTRTGDPMDTAIKSLIATLVGLLALSGVAAAQTTCPECDSDGEANPDNSYHDLDLGAVGEN